MRIQEQKTALFGELVVAAFDGASRYSADPMTVARLATGAVALMLRHTQGQGVPSLPPIVRERTASPYQSA